MFFFSYPVIPDFSLPFTDKGDVAAIDYEFGDLTIDGQWHDLDLSSKVGAIKCLVCIRAYLDANAAGKQGKFRTKGHTYNYNASQIMSNVASVGIYRDLWIVTDTAGKLEYWFTADLVGTIRLTVAHYFTL